MLDGVVVRNHMPHKPYFRFLRSSHGRGEGGGSAVGRVHGWLRPPDPLADAGMTA
jgi:hypothetical protein